MPSTLDHPALAGRLRRRIWREADMRVTSTTVAVRARFLASVVGQFEKRTAGIASRAERSKGWSRPSGLQTAYRRAPGFSPGGTSAAEAAPEGGLLCSAKALLHPKSRAAPPKKEPPRRSSEGGLDPSRNPGSASIQARENSELTHYLRVTRDGTFNRPGWQHLSNVTCSPRP
jgi:hypothetical protein